MDDPDAETEFYFQGFSSDLKGNIIVALYEKTCRDHYPPIKPNDPVGNYFLFTPGGICARSRIEHIILDLFIQMLITEEMVPLSEAARKEWTDEMCERMKWSDGDNEE
ncbi:hypothetical protein E8E11_009895 [Didymella keratinophila]|nr:hypothetical protein E8E11_009895 [Didymella keratinophila]